MKEEMDAMSFTTCSEVQWKVYKENPDVHVTAGKGATVQVEGSSLS